MKVSVVIPNWNGKDKLEKNLPEVLKTEGVFEFIVVDDGSSDDSAEFIEKNFPQVKLIKKNRNMGFSSAVNTGVKEAKGELVFLLNSDALPKRNCLKNILPHFENKRVFSVGFNTGGSWAWAKFENGFFWHGQRPKNGDFHQTLWVSGGSGIFKKSVWDELGGLDELFNPFYEEDVDLGYRATKRGYINIWESRGKVEHYKQKGVIEENFSKSKIASVAQRNQLIFIWKNITDERLFAEHKKALVKMVFTHLGYLFIFLSAFMHLDGIKKKRQAEKKEEILSDEEILDKFS